MNTCKTFEEITKLVKSEFEIKLTENEIKKTMSDNVKVGRNIFISSIPLPLKKIFNRKSFGRNAFRLIYYSILNKIIKKKYRPWRTYNKKSPAPKSNVIQISVTFCRTLEIDRSIRKKLGIINSIGIVSLEHFPQKIPEIHVS